jgi:hypothetical protein
MADQGVRVLDLVVKANTSVTDMAVVVWNAGSNTAQTALVSILNMTSVPLITDPANSNVLVCVQGQEFRSNSFFYVATANNFVKRVALSSF